MSSKEYLKLQQKQVIKYNKNMNKVTQKLGNLFVNLRGMTTAADVFAGYVKSREMLQTTGRKECSIPTTMGGRYIVTMLPGIGTGPQMMEYVRDVFDAAYVPVDFEVIEDLGDDEAALNSIRRNGVAIKGHIPSLSDTSSNVSLRSTLDLFVYNVHCKTYPNVPSRVSDVDIYVFRQNTEGEYAMLEHESKPGIVESLKIITRKNTERFAKWAYEFAKQEGRKKVTIVHKANIMKYSDGLFLKTVLDVAKDYPEIKTDDLIVDNCCMQIVSKPTNFDVILTPNLYGNIVVSIICGLVGGTGLISGQNYGYSCAVFEVGSRHLAFEDKIYVNPVAMLNASVELLNHLQKNDHADLISEAIRKTLVEDKIHTPDIGGTNTSSEMVECIKKHIRSSMRQAKIKSF